MSRRITLSIVTALAVLAAVAGHVDARPIYFDAFTSQYGIGPADNLYACGVCHIKWTGTGARNLFGTAVEQQLYVGKTITQSLMDIEGIDTDGDGFTNVDEILTYMTLPGYNCDNFQDADGAPAGYDTYIEPLVASCLEPLDIRVEPGSLTIFAEVGTTTAVPVTVYNNGTDFDLNVTAIDFTIGSNAALSVSGVPATPFDIPVGGSVVVTVEFSPVMQTVAPGTLRVSSNDPDTPDLDVPVGVVGFVQNLGDPDERAACFKNASRAFRKYSKIHMKEWTRCYTDEVFGIACDAGSRDLKIAKLEAKLSATVGGSKDKACASAGLTPTLLGVAGTCGGSCADVQVTSFESYVDCLMCQQDEAMQSALLASMGTAPPDLPANTVATAAARACQARLGKGMQKSVDRVMKTLLKCELANVTAVVPVDCSAESESKLTKIRTKLDSSIDKCTSTADMDGCLFEAMPDPMCLGTTAESAGSALVDAVLGLDDE